MLNLPLKISRKVLLLLLVSLVAELAAVTAFYMQQQSVVAGMQTKLQAKLTELSQAQSLSSQLDVLQKKLDLNQAQLRHLEGALPTKEYVPTLLTQLQALALATHNSIGSLKPNLTPAPAAPAVNQMANGDGAAGAQNGAAQKTPGPAAATAAQPAPYEKYEVELSVQGRYQDVMTFLMQLTQFPKIISVDACQLQNQAPGVAGGEGLVTTNLKFTGYILKGN